MENRYLENKIIVKYCKNYYRIINEEFSEFDYMSGKIIQIYQGYIFTINARVKEELKKAVDLDTAVARYFDDREFKNIIINSLKTLKVSKSETNVVGCIVNAIIREYNKYMEGYTRNLYISRWI